MATAFDQIIQAESISSSVTPTGERIDTIKVRSPRMIHADFMTHRVFSRNASSSRAMPSVTLLKDEPYVPHFKHNQPGMQPAEPLTEAEQAEAERVWLEAAAACQKAAAILSKKDGLNVHKQWANRMLEWFGYITVVVTSTDWDNYLGLRDHGDAQDEIIWQAQAVRAALDGARPRALRFGEWHLPFIAEDDVAEVRSFLAMRSLEGIEELERIAWAFPLLTERFPVQAPAARAETQLLLARSTARCARTSFRNFDGTKATFAKDVETFCKLGGSPIHASPFEHQATPGIYPDLRLNGNLGAAWWQFRKFIPNERISER